MPDTWEYREPRGRPQHLPTQVVPPQPAKPYGQTQDIARVAPKLPPAPGPQPSFSPAKPRRDGPHASQQPPPVRPAQWQQPGYLPHVPPPAQIYVQQNSYGPRRAVTQGQLGYGEAGLHVELRRSPLVALLDQLRDAEPCR